MKTILLKCLVLGFLGLIGLAPLAMAQQEVLTVTFMDTADETINVSVPGLPPAIVPELAGGVHVALPLNQDLIAGGTFGTFNYNIYESGTTLPPGPGAVLSDTLQIILSQLTEQPFNTQAQINFISDVPDGVILPFTSNLIANLVETGDLQYAPGFGPTDNGPLIVGFASDIEASPVPEPTSMILFGSGLLGFWGLRRKFKK